MSPHRRAANSNAVIPTPAKNAANLFLQGRSERAAEVRPECADNPAMDHVEAPKQKAGASHEVQ